MKIGLLLPSVIMAEKYKNRIYAPRELFINLANQLGKKHQVFLYCAPKQKTSLPLISGNIELIKNQYPLVKFRDFNPQTLEKAKEIVTRFEYELELTARAFYDAQKNKLDIIHSYLSEFVSHYFAKLIKIPLCYTIHDPRPPKNTLDYFRYKNFPNDNYIAISKSQVKDFRGLINFVDIVYHGIDLKEFSFNPLVAKKSYTLFMGRYLKVKGIDVAISAAKKLNIPLKIAGSANYKTLNYYQKEIKPHLKSGLISETGFLNPKKRTTILKNAKAFLFPIRWPEPFGMVVIEAMACGTPVIAFKNGAMLELIKDGQTGYLVDPKQGVLGFTAAVKKLYSLSESDYQKMRQNCRFHVEKNFTSQIMAKNYEKTYQKIIKNFKRKK